MQEHAAFKATPAGNKEPAAGTEYAKQFHQGEVARGKELQRFQADNDVKALVRERQAFSVPPHQCDPVAMTSQLLGGMREHLPGSVKAHNVAGKVRRLQQVMWDATGAGGYVQDSGSRDAGRRLQDGVCDQQPFIIRVKLLDPVVAVCGQVIEPDNNAPAQKHPLRGHQQPVGHSRSDQQHDESH